MTGTKAAAHYQVTVARRRNGHDPAAAERPGTRCHGRSVREASLQIMQTRQREADEFYRSHHSGACQRGCRPASCARLWPECSGRKQYFGFDVDKWLEEHGADPMRPGAQQMRNSEWFHMVNEHIISMPDKWEYPWFAAWDLAFHTIALSTVDVDFAKEQLDLMLQEFFLHPTGQIPAYEWNFSDVNPPVHAWATIFLIPDGASAQG